VARIRVGSRIRLIFERIVDGRTADCEKVAENRANAEISGGKIGIRFLDRFCLFCLVLYCRAESNLAWSGEPI